MATGPSPRSLLAHVPLFEGLAPQELGRLAAGTTRLALERGDVLFRQGERPTGFYLVVFGRVALKVRAAWGRERVTAIVEAGRSFGEAILFLDKPCIVSAVALTDCVVLHVAREALFPELERNPVLARRLIGALAAKLESTVRELDTYALASSGRRFASWLLQHAAPGTAGAAAYTLPAAKSAIASQLNLSPEHLSRVLRELRDEGLIETKGRTIRIPDAERLRGWSERRPAA